VLSLKSLKNKIILAVFLVLTIVAGIMITRINVNYDLKQYLPDDSETIEGLDIYENEFGAGSYAIVMIEGASVTDSVAVTQELLGLTHVSNVEYLDSVLNQMTFQTLIANFDSQTQTALQTQMDSLVGAGYSYPEAFLEVIDYLRVNLPAPYIALLDPLSLEIEKYYKEGYSKLIVSIDLDQTDLEAETVLDDIVNILENDNLTFYLTGGVVSTIFTRNAISSEVLKITLIVVPLILLLLLFLTPAYFDLVVFVFAAAVAIILNLGTNALLPNISFITHSIAIVLQLAISLDYIIFIMSRYHEERDKGLSSDEAIKAAMKKVTVPVIASASTTGVSFLALLFMKFSIGIDIGIVFFKAIVFSLLVALFLVPVLIKIFAKQIDKSRHRVFMPKFGKFAKFVYKFRYLLLAFLMLIVPFAYYFQTHNDFVYGDSALTMSKGSEYYEDTEAIENIFGFDDRIVVLTDKNVVKEALFYQAVSTDESLPLTDIKSGVYYSQMISDPETLAAVLSNFYTDDYEIIILTFDMDPESEEAENVLATLKEHLASSGISEYYLLGSTPVAYETRDIISSDYDFVTLIALIAVMLIIFLTFKNFLMPIILPLVIVASVFVTMSVSYFAGYQVVFLGYLIISTILLGATIDYAILFGKRYLELRNTYGKHDSIQKAISDTAPSITTSAIIFAVAGLMLSVVSSIVTIRQIGGQIAIGAMLALFYVLVLLPQLFYIFDRWIKRSNVERDKR